MSRRKNDVAAAGAAVAIRVTSADRARALIGGIPMRARPVAESFDPAQTKKRLQAVLARGWWEADWDRAGLSIATSVEEARIAYAAMRNDEIAKGDARIDALVASPPTQGYAGVGIERTASSLAIAAYRALGIAEVASLFLDTYGDESGWLEGLEQDVLPYLDADERRHCADLLRPGLANGTWTLASLRALLALGEPPDTVRAILRTHPAGSGRPRIIGISCEYTENSWLRAVVGLGEPDEVAREAERLDALPFDASEARMLLAATGARCLDLIVRAVQASLTKASAESLTKALALAEVPECAPAMLAIATESKAKGIARAWLDERPSLAFAGLLPVVMGGGARAAEARTYLESLVRRGHRDAMEQAIADLPTEAADAIRASIAPSVKELPIVADEELPAWAAHLFLGGARPTTSVATLTSAQLDDRTRIEPAPQRDGAGRAGHEDADDSAGITRLPPTEPRPNVRSFDPDALRTLMPASGPAWYQDADRRTLAMPVEEARAHLAADAVSRNDVGREVEACLSGPASHDFASMEIRAPLAVPAFVVLGVAGVARALDTDSWGLRGADVVVDRIVRYLSADERDALLRCLIAREHPSMVTVELAYRLGASREDLQALLERLELDDPYGFRTDALLECIYRLGDVDAIVAEALRRKVGPRATASRWLAKTGHAGVGVLASAVRASRSPEMFAVLARVVSEEAARAMLGLLGVARLKPLASTWIEAHPLIAIDAFSALIGTKTLLAGPAAKQLRRLCARGFAPYVEQRTQGNTKVAKAVFERIGEGKKASDGDRALAMVLPPITIATTTGPCRLGPDHVARVVAELRASQLGEPTEAVETLREHLPADVRDPFAWAVFSSWIDESSPAKDRWKLDALALVGADACAAALVPFIKEWPTTNQFQRAIRGIDCLRAIGSDAAIRELHGIAERMKRESLRNHANVSLDLVAQDRGLSRDELGDRIVPDGGLDAQGARVLDFGARAFTAVVGRDLKPMLRDQSGKKIATLPKAAASDDPARASEAHAAWKLLKKQVADVAKAQVARLELAMITGRRWSLADFETLVVRHPLMNRLAQRLVWSTFDAAGNPSQWFRVADDWTYADANDAGVVMDESVTGIGLVHAMHASPEERAAWQATLAEYDILPAFEQLNRPIHLLTPDESQASAITRFTAHDVDPKSLVFGLESLGWFRGAIGDGGRVRHHSRAFGAFQASVEYEPGYYGGGSDGWERQRIVRLRFSTRNGAAVLPSSTDAIVASEAIRDVTFVYERGAPQ